MPHATDHLDVVVVPADPGVQPDPAAVGALFDRWQAQAGIVQEVVIAHEAVDRLRVEGVICECEAIVRQQAAQLVIQGFARRPHGDGQVAAAGVQAQGSVKPVDLAGGVASFH